MPGRPGPRRRCGAPTSIREAEAADAAPISAVILAALRGSNAADYPSAVIERLAAGFAPERVADLLSRRLTFVAAHGGAVVGTAALDGAVVRGMFVHPDVQRRGIGTALLARVARAAAARGAAELTLQSSLTAQGFYVRLGFAPVRDLWEGEERTVVMRASARRLAARGRDVEHSAPDA